MKQLEEWRWDTSRKVMIQICKDRIGRQGLKIGQEGLKKELYLSEQQHSYLDLRDTNVIRYQELLPLHRFSPRSVTKIKCVLTEDDADTQGPKRFKFAITPWESIRGRPSRNTPSRQSYKILSFPRDLACTDSETLTTYSEEV